MIAQAHYPLLLYEAVLKLYLESEAGGKGEEVWFGACASNLRLHDDFQEVLLAASGATVRSAYHVDEEHTIDIERLWILRKSIAADFSYVRNRRYVLEMYFENRDGYWTRLTYSGVTWRSRERGSQGVLEFRVNQSLRAESVIQEGGTVADGSGGTSTIVLGDEASVGFFREQEFTSGEYLLGHYKWAADAMVTFARVIATAGSSPAVVTLEVNGILTPVTLTIPAGVGEVSAEVTFSAALPAGQSVRWICTSAPATAPSYGAVVMQVTPA